MDAQAPACPRCGTPVAAHQQLCSECGEQLAGRSFPGGWLLRAAAALAVAVTAGAVAVAIGKDDGRRPVVAPALSTTAVTAAAAPATAPSAAPITSASATSPVAPTTAAATTPAPVAVLAVAAAGPGATTWPARGDGWTVVIASLPRTMGTTRARTRAAAAGHAGLLQTGVLLSNDFASLQPDYLVVFSGVYGSLAAAQQAAAAAQSSFPGAYSRRIAR